MLSGPRHGSAHAVASDGITIRPMRRRDIPAVVELRRRHWPDVVETPASFAWELDRPDPDAHDRRWVATDRRTVVGWARSGLATWAEGRAGQAFVGVDPGHRHRGIGGRLWSRVEDHLARLHPTTTVSGSDVDDADATPFLDARGFQPARRAQSWSLDPRTVRLVELPDRLAAAEAAGFRLLPVRELLDRPHDLYALHRALEADLPSDIPIASRYEGWRLHQLETPLFSPDASFCVLDGDLPVALTWIFLDADGHRAGNGMTGTLRAYRHRGLARLVKLASIQWLAGHGVTALFTDNDTENHDMLALNEHLGYRPLLVIQEWTRSDPGA